MTTTTEMIEAVESQLAHVVPRNLRLALCDLLQEMKRYVEKHEAQELRVDALRSAVERKKRAQDAIDAYCAKHGVTQDRLSVGSYPDDRALVEELREAREGACEAQKALLAHGAPRG